MEKIIKEVLEVEKDVDKIIQEAREKASEIKKKAEKEASEKISDTRLKAQKIIQDSAEKAREETKKIREEKLTEAEDQSKKFLQKNKKKIDKFVDEITRRIIITRYEKGNS